MVMLSFLEQIQLCSVADKNFMCAIQRSDTSCIHFISISYINAMKVQTKEETHRIHRTV